MGYDPQVVRRASERLAQAREDKASQARDHLARAYEQVPRIREIDRQMRLTMARAAQAVFTPGADAQALMDAAHRENIALQKEREALAAANFPEGYLDDSPICPVCGGLGYMGSTMCSCLAELCREEQQKELTALNVGTQSFDEFRLSYYSDTPDPRYGASPRAIMEKTYQVCRQYACHFAPGAENLLLSGACGLGKTFLSGCIARTVADRGYGVVYESAPNLFAVLEQDKFSATDETRQAARRYRSCDLLILDDLGTELAGQFVTYALYALVNDRLMDKKSTIISTNLTSEELTRRYSAQIASRLRGEYRRVAFVGQDIRMLRGQDR